MNSKFTPVIWPEDKAPEESIHYKQCEVCTPKSRIIWGEGNNKAYIVVVLDNPGVREDKKEKSLFVELGKRCRLP